MELRKFGRTGMQVSVLGFGCGAVGGLMVRGAPADQERAIARALEAGVNYFDTAVQYGNGESERNLGRILKRLKPAGVIVGTKVRLAPGTGDARSAIAKSIDGSLERLMLERVDILHFHNPITRAGGGTSTSVLQLKEEIVPAFEALRAQGKIRFLGLTATGETEALMEAIGTRAFDSAQVTYNLLNPSAATSLPPGFPGQDYGRLFDPAAAAGTGVIGIRVLAGGALSGTAERHPIASPPPEPIGSSLRYEGDLARAGRFAPLVEEGYASTLAEAATRYCISPAAVGTILVGVATPQQFEDALAAVLKGPLPEAALARIASLQQGFAGEAR